MRKAITILFKIEISHIDFEIGVIEATKEVFPGIKIKICCYNLGHAWWNKVN